MIKSRKIWYGLLLVIAVVVAAIAIFSLTNLARQEQITEPEISEAKGVAVVLPEKITPEDVHREGIRSWILMYKMDEGAPEGIWPEGHPRRIAMEERNKLFDQYFEEGADQTHSLEERYWIAVKTNRIMEKCLEETGSDPYIDPQDVDSERKRFLELRDKMEQVRPEQWPEEPGYDLRAFCIETRQQAADQHFDPTASLQDQYWQVFRLNVHMKECLEEISPN